MLIINKNCFCRYKVLLVSSGGAGCSYINRRISKHIKHINTEANSDYLKHLYSPESHLMDYNKFENIIFVYNDPLSAILSHFRREWQLMMHKQINPKDRWIKFHHLTNAQTYFDYVMRTEEDGFGMIDHARRWVEYSPCLFVDFRNVEETQEAISEKLEIPLKLEKRERNSDAVMQNVPKEVADIYTNLDRKFLEETNR